MDWIKQKTFQNWVIGVLVALNLLALTIVWIQSSREVSRPVREARSLGGVSVALMQEALDLSAEQAEQYGQLRAKHMEPMKELNDELDSLKLRLADMAVAGTEGIGESDSIGLRIGALQSRLEILRFRHFRALADICNEEQKQKLRPILREVLGRRGPTGRTLSRPGADAPPPGSRAERAQPEKPTRHRTDGGEQQEPRGGERPKPPSMKEKVSRYAERLSLTSEQAAEVESIMSSTRASEEAFKVRVHPTREEFEQEKARLREQEDQSILKILSPEQKAEFQKMVKNRGNPPPRD